jgi:ketosteroid isomerase-like protein
MPPSHTAPVDGPEDADQGFFTALTGGDADALDALLTDDFLLVDVLRGDVMQRANLVGAIRDGLLRFDAIVPEEAVVRRYGDAAIVVGRTEMAGSFAQTPWRARSRYTHVFVRRDGRWRLASAQGTPIP